MEIIIHHSPLWPILPQLTAAFGREWTRLIHTTLFLWSKIQSLYLHVYSAASTSVSILFSLTKIGSYLSRMTGSVALHVSVCLCTLSWGIAHSVLITSGLPMEMASDRS